VDRKRLIRLARRLKLLNEELSPKEQKSLSKIVSLWMRAVGQITEGRAAVAAGAPNAHAARLDPEGDYASDIALVAKLVDFVRGAEPADFFLVKDLLSTAVSYLPIDGTLPRTQGEYHAFRLIQRWLFELRRGTRPGLQTNGLIWRGRPFFMTDDLLQALLAESTNLRPDAKRQKWAQFTCSVTRVAQCLSEGIEIRSLIGKLVGSIDESSTAIYLYYDEPGAHVRPHVDGDRFSINMNLMLHHSGSGSAPSDLVLYPMDGAPERVRLGPGELVLMYADCVVHTRTPVSVGEIVRNLAMGFQPSHEMRRSANDPELIFAL
jgi:hypothetical protein